MKRKKIAVGKVKAKAKNKVKAKIFIKAKTKVKAKMKSAKVKSAKKAKPIKPKTVNATKNKKAVPPKSKNLKTKTLPKKALTPTKTIDYAKVVTPLGDRLVVRLVVAERMTPGGLYIPDTVSDVQGHLKGEVLAAGSGARNKKGNKRPLDVIVGDKIYFNEYSATKINFGLEELHIVKETDVLGVVK